MSAKYLWVALFVVFGCLSSLRAQPSDNFYVDPAAPSGGDGSSWATAFQTISEAVTEANATFVDDRIWLAPGIHQPTGPMSVIHPCTVGAPLGTATIDYSGVLPAFVSSTPTSILPASTLAVQVEKLPESVVIPEFALRVANFKGVLR